MHHGSIAAATSRKHSTLPALICLGSLLATTLALPLTTRAQAASGYSVTNFVTGFANNGAEGPIGLAFDSAGNLYVGDYATGFIYKFDKSGGIASSSTQLNGTAIPGAIAGMSFTKDGSLYLARQSSADVVQIDTTSGAVLRTVATGLTFATALATDPISGDLFVSQPTVGIVSRISNFATGTGTVTLYATTGDVDGLSFGPDGTLYAALPAASTIAKISGTNSSNPGTVTPYSLSLPTLDGLAVSANPSKLFIYANANNGTITKVDFTVTPATQNAIFTGGTRGDFVNVGPDGCLYATQTDRVLKVTNADGTCLVPPLGPLFPSNPSVTYTFSAFCAAVDADDEKNGFDLHAKFRLAHNSDGIDLASDALMLTVDTVSISIPAGSFHKTKSGAWRYEGKLDSMHIAAELTPVRNTSNAYMLMIEVKGASLTSADKPYTVTLTIGDDSGTTVAWDQDSDDH
jgi:hypothetical protein